MANKFGRWTVIAGATRKPRSSGGHVTYVLARCKCGTKRNVSLPNLVSGKSKSCGCFRSNKTRTTKTRHGDARKGMVAVEYSCWQSMIKRCGSDANPDYGGRGIKVCDRWMTYEHFLADMGRKPSAKHSLDRYPDNNGYEPTNCRWATPKQQRANQRQRSRLDQFTEDELLEELKRRGWYTPPENECRT